ncbi:MAG: hypothetical protein GX458_02465 [Phyllobacteriaceae bacterium]|nr:hypothetical protein [Phyllobacteriaceae bacterium]
MVLACLLPGLWACAPTADGSPLAPSTASAVRATSDTAPRSSARGTAATYAPGSVTVPRGRESPLNPVYQSMTTDCRSLPRPTVRVIAAPRLGRIEARPAQGITTFGPGPWAACWGRIGDGTVIFFVAPDRIGHDRFTVEVMHSDGTRIVVPYRIEVTR